MVAACGLTPLALPVLAHDEESAEDFARTHWEGSGFDTVVVCAVVEKRVERKPKASWSTR